MSRNVLKRTVKGISARSAAVFFCLLLSAGCAYVGHQVEVAYVEVNSHTSPNGIEIEIYDSFIRKYQDRATIDAKMTVDKAASGPNPPFFDGDFHFAGRTPQVGLPTVAEITNGALEVEAVDIVHRLEGTREQMNISGAWRLWPEHAGTTEEEQGEKLPPLESSNPDHVFEIHPVTRINNVSLLRSFVPVRGYQPGNARTAFDQWEKTGCRLRVKYKTVSIVTGKGLYNDAEFIMEITDPGQLAVRDGRFVTASVRDLQGNLLVKQLRMVFVKDTPPERSVRDLKRGDRLHVWGMPRVNFSEIYRRVREYKKDVWLLAANLPYEIIIIGVYDSK